MDSKKLTQKEASFSERVQNAANKLVEKRDILQKAAREREKAAEQMRAFDVALAKAQVEFKEAKEALENITAETL